MAKDIESQTIRCIEWYEDGFVQKAVEYAFQPLPSGSLIFFMGNLRYAKVACAMSLEVGSRMLKGSAVKLVRHAQQPFLDVFSNGWIHLRRCRNGG